MYLMKTYSKTPKNKENVNQNYVEYILRLHFVKVTWCHLGWHYNVTWVTLQCHLGDITMSLRVTVKRWTYHTYDNAQRHVTAFWPISEAAQKWFHGPTRVHTPNTFGLHCLYFLLRAIKLAKLLVPRKFPAPVYSTKIFQSPINFGLQHYQTVSLHW